MNKQTVIQPYNGTSLSNKKEQTTTAGSNNLDESQRHLSRIKEASLKKPHTVLFHLYDIKKKKTEIENWFPGLGVGDGCDQKVVSKCSLYHHVH